MNRPSRGAPAWALAILTASLLPSPGLAHQYWIAPSRYAAVPGGVIELGTAVGTGFRGTRVRWDPARSVRFVARTSGTLSLERIATPGETAWARFSPDDSGGAMIAFESAFRPIELPAGEFDAYLREEGLDEPLRVRRRARGGDRPGRELYRRCAKAWIAGSDRALATGRAAARIGLPLEIVPASIPGAGDALSLRVLANGAPAMKVLVKAWRSPVGHSGRPRDPETRDSTGVVWSARTNANGEVVVPTMEDGEWLVSAVRMEACRDHEIADWESTWASLTFERRRAR